MPNWISHYEDDIITPIFRQCSWCNFRDDTTTASLEHGGWRYTKADCTEIICPECVKGYYKSQEAITKYFKSLKK